MISEILNSDISKYNFVYKQNFWISDISNCIVVIIDSIDDISKWFNYINNSIFDIIILISDISMINFWYL